MPEPQQQSTSDNQQNSNSGNGSSAQSHSEPPEWYKNPPEWMKTPPQQTPPQQQNQGSDNRHTVAQELMQRLDALPEQIAKFINEAKPQQPAQSTQNNAGGSGEHQQPGPRGKTRQEKFRDWWFN